MKRWRWAAWVVIAAGCAPAPEPSALGTGSDADPVVQLARQALVVDTDTCLAGTTQGPRRLIFDDFGTGAGASPNWPMNRGYDAEFNADWDLLNGRARPGNPSWPGADRNAPPRPVTTGIVKFLDVCPLPGASLSASAIADTTEATDAITDSTMVVYVFDGAGSVISIHASYALRAGNRKLLSVRGVPLPVNARRVALVPMARLGPTEAMTVYYDDLALDVDPTFTEVANLNDDFSTAETGQYGPNQPAGWGEWGGADFFIYNGAWATVWNGSWGGEPLTVPPWEGGAFKTVPLPAAVRAGDVVRASVLSANTFSDATSYSMYRLTMGSTVAASAKLFGKAWSVLEVGPVVVPAGATSVTQELLVGLGPTESSSLYFDDLSVRFLRPGANARAAKTYSPKQDYPAVFELGSVADVGVPSVLPIDTASYPGAATPWNVAAGNTSNKEARVLFTTATGSTVTCTYRGSTSQSSRYAFVSCSNGALAGGLVAAVKVEVRIDDGASNQPSTRVAVPLSWTYR